MNINIFKAKELPLDFDILILNFTNEQKKVEVIWRLMKPCAVYEAFSKISVFCHLFMSLDLFHKGT